MMKFAALFLVAVSLTAITGCSSGSSGSSGSGAKFGLFGDDTAQSDKSTYYAVAAGASVFAKASPESRLLGKLQPSERVTKIGEAKGFAHVRARAGAMIGWVHESKLSRRQPAGPAPQSGSPGMTSPP
jgi:hypothetical protein